MEYGAVRSSAPSGTPSNRNCTPTTPLLSLAVADTVTVPETAAPFAGAVIDIVGAVLSIVTLTVGLVVKLPAASRARADSV
jgi:hypothetical protein